jgi:hypothetical protein
MRPGSALPRFGVGLTNTMDRLQIHYGERHTFLYSDRPEGGVKIEISIPYSEAGDGAGARGLRQAQQEIRAAAPTIGYN